MQMLVSVGLTAHAMYEGLDRVDSDDVLLNLQAMHLFKCRGIVAKSLTSFDKNLHGFSCRSMMLICQPANQQSGRFLIWVQAECRQKHNAKVSIL